MTRAEFLSHREHWITKIQLDLYSELKTYMDQNDINRTQLAERLGVTKGYISQVLNGDFDHKISKLVDLALLMTKVPEIRYPSLINIIIDDMTEESAETPLPFSYEATGGKLESLELDMAPDNSSLNSDFVFSSK